MAEGPPDAVASNWLVRGGGDFDQLVGPNSAFVGVMPQYQTRIEGRTVGSVTTFYKGWALSGAAEGDNAWMIQRIVLDRTTELDVTGTIAGGARSRDEDPFRFSWTGRAGHAYS